MSDHDPEKRRRRQRPRPITSPVVPLVAIAGPSGPAPATDMFAALDAVMAAHRRIALELIQLGSVAAVEPLRALGELQSAGVDAAWPTRTSGAAGARPDAFEWAGWSIVSALDATERMLTFVATGSAIIARSVGRMSDTLARSREAIQEAVSPSVRRVVPSPPGR